MTIRNVCGVVAALCAATVSFGGDDVEPGGFFEGPGTLGIGPQACVVFNGDGGQSFAIEDLGGFVPGDRVFVSGTVDPKSTLCFPVIMPGIPDNDIAGYFEQCGILGPGPQGCPAIFTDDEQLFVLENVDGFVGGSVFVAGVLDPSSTLCLPYTGPGIEMNSIVECLDGDANRDGSVDVQDLIAVIQGWGPCPPFNQCPGDVTGDGTVDVQDLVTVVSNWT